MNFEKENPSKAFDLSAVGYEVACFDEILKFLQKVASALPKNTILNEEQNETLDEIEELFEDDRNGKNTIDRALGLLGQVIYELIKGINDKKE